METETITENQKVRVAKKLKKMFGHMDRREMEYCPIRDVMALASDKWSILIILYLGYFPILRFNQLKKKVYGISNKVLSERLKILEADGYLSRQMYPEVPIRVEYQLTTFGHSYLLKLIDLSEWVTTYSDQIIDNRKRFKKG
ncbi:helix-turn-helix transcriptional regulator [Aggregatimonas sangjinii]|uniref:Helix-turn-helix transcriptional regulator n=1 Tax=Aggregatimonas sangjinii TaxID=2583587 RepID=A0A5B7SUP7_9FLAO|nr:helix-turn-helix domain-containing protein [Aggregatimonas sangjinii]QCX01009.1 helix-turn-helix transcriptional regulator [Aggregatimonas sangjinii]